MCEQDVVEAARNRAGAAAGGHCSLLTPEARNYLQTCLVSVELLAALELPSDAFQCGKRIERAVYRLVDDLTAGDPGFSSA